MGVYYKKTHKIAGINFLPRLTLAEYNNLTVKPEHWIRTDSPFDYSKTDVPKLTLEQYEDLAIKPKFWIRTDAPESYTHMSATQVDMTDSVSVFDYLDDLDANQVKYSNGVSVKDKIEELNDKVYLVTPRGAGTNIDTQTKIDELPVGSTIYGYVTSAISPFGIQNWATIETVGQEGAVKNQSFISINGIAFRHWENESWSAWKKTSFS